MVIERHDRIHDLIREDEGFIEVLAGLSPALARLRDPGMRRVMSRLLTVEGAAQMAGLDPDAVLARLNGEGHPEGSRGSSPAGSPAAGRPAALGAIPEDRVVHLDVREDLRSGREPFSRIMATRHTVPAGGALCLRAIFEPVPLYAVMAQQGFAHHAERLTKDDWRVWFYPAMGGGADLAGPDPSPAESDEDPGVHEDGGGVRILDVRGLEPPEPMVRTLEALESLPEGHTLIQVNVRVPRFLLPQLEERGFTCEIREPSPGLVRLFIRRAR